MTSAIRLGVENAETDSIVHGLMTMLEILQAINLDAANHSIKNLRVPWVEDTVAFEQKYCLERIADGWDVIGAQIWFQDLHEAEEETASGLWVLVKAVTNAVVFCHRHFPPTFTLDYNRLRTLQSDFQALVYQAACQRTLSQILRFRGSTCRMLPGSYANLYPKVAALISDQELQYDYPNRRESVAAEIVRAAYAVCSKRKVPTSKDLKFAENYLRHCCDPKKPVFGVLRNTLAILLKDRVDDEVCAIDGLTPAQLMRRLLPSKPWFAVHSENEGLVHIAKRISHIAELHWRIWGPILYEQPVYVGGRALSHTSPIEKGVHDQETLPSRITDESEELLRDTGSG